MQKWEYLFVSIRNSNYNIIPHAYTINGNKVENWEKTETLYEYCNKLGNEGWELVAMDGNLVFKRPKG